MSAIGHNSGNDAHGVARDQLRSFVERIERLNSEIADIQSDRKDVYGEARSMGFDTKQIKRLIAIRKMDERVRMEEDAILDVYLSALGMLPTSERDLDAVDRLDEDEDV